MILIEQYSDKSGLLETYFFTAIGKIIVVIVMVSLLISAVNEWIMAFSKRMTQMTTQHDLNSRNYAALMLLGRIGRFSRGLVFLAFAYIFGRPLVMNLQRLPYSESDAFAFMQSQFGAISMFVVASGLALYGAFLILSSKYRNIPIQ
jgi:hypothetical protein